MNPEIQDMSDSDLVKLRKKYPERNPRGKAIKLYCKEMCCCGDMGSWKECPLKSCFLWNFRFGKEILNPEKLPSKKHSIVSKSQVKQGSEQGVSNE